MGVLEDSAQEPDGETLGETKRPPLKAQIYDRKTRPQL